MGQTVKNKPKKITLDVDPGTYRDIMKSIKKDLDVEARPNVGEYIRRLIQEDLKKRP